MATNMNEFMLTEHEHGSVLEELKNMKTQLNQVEQKAVKKTETCLEELEQAFQSLRTKVTEQAKLSQKTMEEIETQVDTLTVKATKLGFDLGDSQHQQGQIKDLKHSSKRIRTLMERSSLSYYEIQKDPNADVRCTLVQKDIPINWAEQKSQTETHFAIQDHRVKFMCLGIHDSVFSLAEAWHSPRLSRYSLRTGNKIDQVEVDSDPQGLATVQLEGVPCVAISSGKEKRIQFRDQKNLSSILHNVSLYFNSARLMCPASPTTFVYQSGLYSVQWFDCQKSPPKSGPSKFDINRLRVFDMCFLNQGEEQLLLLARGDKGLACYNTVTGDQKWVVEGKGPTVIKQKGDIVAISVTADENGHIFVSDPSSYCVHMFAVSNGAYLGSPLKRGDRGLGSPGPIRWSESLQSLVVAYQNGSQWLKSDQWLISVIKVKV